MKTEKMKPSQNCIGFLTFSAVIQQNKVET